MSATSAERLRKIMDMKGLRQVDVLALTKPYCEQYKVKIGKSDLSQYLSGKVTPSQWKLSILGLALNVSESWLMGLDVPMERPAATIDHWTKNFEDRLREELDSHSRSDLEEAGIDLRFYEHLIESPGPITLSTACEVADTLGLSLDEMVGNKKDPDHASVTGISDLDRKIIQLYFSIPANRRQEAENYLSYLANQ